MVWWIYYALIYVMTGWIRLAAIWNHKAHLSIQGRRKWKNQLSVLPKKQDYRIWFHVSSLGEFEQARPVIELLYHQYGVRDMILTFFSPSGFTIRSGYPFAKVLYLPFDLPGHAAYWVKALAPDVAVFVKYDLWPGYLKALLEKNTACFLISANWETGHHMASWNIPPTRSLLKQFRKIFLQQEQQADAFRAKGFTNVEFAGDTRIDRCLQLPAEVEHKLPDVLKSVDRFDIVAGSTWPRDEALLMQLAVKFPVSMIIAPHDVSETNITRLCREIPVSWRRLSQMDVKDEIPQIIVIDTIGLLNVLYAIGRVAYIGGGFGQGIHNTLEPMAHGLPLIFGPRYNAFPEAVSMVAAQAAISISDFSGLEAAYARFSGTKAQEVIRSVTSAFLEKNKGAAQKVTKSIAEVLPFGGKR